MPKADLDGLQRAWHAAPHDAGLGYRFAEALFEVGAFDQVHEVLVAVMDVTRAPDRLTEIGRFFETIDAWSEARIAYERAVEQDPLHADALGLSAAVTLRIEGIEAAQPRLRKWASFSEHPVEAHFAVASMMVEEGAFDAAADHLQIALDLDPEHLAAQQLQGVVLGKQGDFAGSVAAWRAALALDPGNQSASAGLGVALSRAGDHAGAVPLLEAGVLGPTECCRLGVSLRELGEIDRAVEVLTEAAALTAEDPEVFLELGRTYLSRNEAESAASALQRASALAPGDGVVHHQLGRALVALGREPQALAAHLKAAALRPHDEVVQADLRRLQDGMRGIDIGEPSEEVSVPEISGQLDVVSLPNLLEFLTTNGSSGLLEITSGQKTAHVYLDAGSISAAQTTSGPRLGDMLVESGDISREQLEDALSDPGAQTVGRALVEQGLVPEDTLSDRMDTQIVEVLSRVVTWPGSAFRFQQGQAFTAKSFCAHALDARFALMEVMRRLDEARAHG